MTGTYAQEGSTPLFRVKAMTHRKDPIFHAMQCGLAPSEAHSLIGTTIEMKLWEHLRGIDGGELELLDVRCIGGMSPLMVVVQVRQAERARRKTAALAALSSPYLHPKFAVAVDDDIDPSDVDQVMWAIATRLEAGHDVAARQCRARLHARQRLADRARHERHVPRRHQDDLGRDPPTRRPPLSPRPRVGARRIARRDARRVGEIFGRRRRGGAGVRRARAGRGPCAERGSEGGGGARADCVRGFAGAHIRRGRGGAG